MKKKKTIDLIEIPQRTNVHQDMCAHRVLYTTSAKTSFFEATLLIDRILNIFTQ